MDMDDLKQTGDLKIVLWHNGFQIDEDGPIRLYEDPKNKSFINELRMALEDKQDAHVPAELLRQMRG